jgi:hypothetical protein
MYLKNGESQGVEQKGKRDGIIDFVYKPQLKRL